MPPFPHQKRKNSFGFFQQFTWVLLALTALVFLLEDANTALFFSSCALFSSLLISFELPNTLKLSKENYNFKYVINKIFKQSFLYTSGTVIAVLCFLVLPHLIHINISINIQIYGFLGVILTAAYMHSIKTSLQTAMQNLDAHNKELNTTSHYKKLHHDLLFRAQNNYFVWASNLKQITPVALIFLAYLLQKKGPYLSMNFILIMVLVITSRFLSMIFMRLPRSEKWWTSNVRANVMDIVIFFAFLKIVDIFFHIIPAANPPYNKFDPLTFLVVSKIILNALLLLHDGAISSDFYPLRFLAKHFSTTESALSSQGALFSQRYAQKMIFICGFLSLLGLFISIFIGVNQVLDTTAFWFLLALSTSISVDYVFAQHAHQFAQNFDDKLDKSIQKFDIHPEDSEYSSAKALSITKILSARAESFMNLVFALFISALLSSIWHFMNGEILFFMAGLLISLAFVGAISFYQNIQDRLQFDALKKVYDNFYKRVQIKTKDLKKSETIIKPEIDEIQLAAARDSGLKFVTLIAVLSIISFVLYNFFDGYRYMQFVCGVFSGTVFSLFFINPLMQIYSALIHNCLIYIKLGHFGGIASHAYKEAYRAKIAASSLESNQESIRFTSLVIVMGFYISTLFL